MSQDKFGGFPIKCQQCGTGFTIYSPGQEYIEIIDQDCPRGDSLTNKKTCPKCEFQNKIIWDRDHDLLFNKDRRTDRNLAGVD